MDIGKEFSVQRMLELLERVESLSSGETTTRDGLRLQEELGFEIRRFLVCLPNRRLKESQMEEYLGLVCGERAEQELVDLVRRDMRQRRLTSNEYEQLERRQGGRCAICGVILTTHVKPHVDHVFPLSLGGKDDLVNMQLLCRKCNLGKGSLMHWIMAAPWFKADDTLTAETRYCVLRRHGGKCNVPSCLEDATTGEMHVTTIIPLSRGGRYIFDNLQCVCTVHRDAYLRANEERARIQLKGAGRNFQNFGFGGR